MWVSVHFGSRIRVETSKEERGARKDKEQRERERERERERVYGGVDRWVLIIKISPLPIAEKVGCREPITPGREYN